MNPDAAEALARRRAAILSQQAPVREARWYHYALGGVIGTALFQAVWWMWG